MGTWNIYYQSIDEMPLNNWQKCQNGELHYVRKDKKEFEPGKFRLFVGRYLRIVLRRYVNNQIKCFEHWERLYDEYIKRHGLGDKYEDYLKLQVQLTNAQIDYVINRDRKVLNRVDMINAKLDSMMEFGVQQQELTATLVHLSKWAGVKLTIFETTVHEFFTYMNEFKKSTDG